MNRNSKLYILINSIAREKIVYLCKNVEIPTKRRTAERRGWELISSNCLTFFHLFDSIYFIQQQRFRHLVGNRRRRRHRHCFHICQKFQHITYKWEIYFKYILIYKFQVINAWSKWHCHGSSNVMHGKFFCRKMPESICTSSFVHAHTHTHIHTQFFIRSFDFVWTNRTSGKEIDFRGKKKSPSKNKPAWWESRVPFFWGAICCKMREIGRNRGKRKEKRNGTCCWVHCEIVTHVPWPFWPLCQTHEVRVFLLPTYIT